jgi:hypothetical protein
VPIFVLEDEFHAEVIARFSTRDEAWQAVRKRASDPGSIENRAPCTSWSTCKREYVIVEYDVSKQPWIQLSRQSVLTVEQGRAIWPT